MRPELVCCLERASELLVVRLSQLEDRLREGDEVAWCEYRQTLETLANLLNQVAPGRRGELLTTAQMAARLNVTPKTLLRRKARGEVRPTLQRGKLIRWRGDEMAK